MNVYTKKRRVVNMSQASTSGKKMIIYTALFFGMTLIIIILGNKVLENSSGDESSHESLKAAKRTNKNSTSRVSIPQINVNENGEEMRSSILSMDVEHIKAIYGALRHVYQDGRVAMDGIKGFLIKSKKNRKLSANMIKLVDGLIKYIESSSADGKKGILAHSIMMLNNSKMNAVISLAESLQTKYQKKMMQRQGRRQNK